MVLKKTINEVVSLFRQAASYALPSDGELVFENDQTLTVHSRWSQRDIERKEKTILQRSHVINLSSGKTISQIGPQEVNELYNKSSPSGNYRAVLRSGKDKKNEDKQYLEIYNKTRKLRTLDVLAFEKHGKILKDDGQFGSFEWSRSEKQLLYVAEKKRQKTVSFFDTKGQKGDGDNKPDKEDEVKRGCENEYYENWGEALTDAHHPVICVIDLETDVVTVLDNVDDNLSSGQAMWAPDDAGVVFCAWDHEPYRLGLRHCCQRKGGLFYFDIQKGVVERLSPEGRSVRYPRFSPNMSRLIYLDTPVGGAHHQCSRLLVIDWATRKSRVVVDIVKHAPASSFQGIFTAAVPRNVWFEDNVHLALPTAWRSMTTVVIVNTDSGTVKRLPKDENQKSVSLLGVEKSCMLLSSSSLTIPFHLIVAKLKDLDNPETIQWIFPDGTPETLDSLSSWEVLQHKPTADRICAINGDLDYESILCMPQKEDGTLPPLIVFSHGGPHVGFDTSYNVIANFFCLCGFSVLMVNYRGSWGFGQDFIDSLHGAVGDVDVKDVQSAMMSVLSKGVVNSDNILASGGSHGGFLTAHLIGQYPTTFNAAATRNPVINLISMFSTTDIKDWIFVEGGYPFDMASLIDDTMFSELWKRSPISYVNQVMTPVLLMVGLEDKRVPPNQAMEYYRALKARNIPVRCLTYPSSNHGLAEVDVEGDCMVNTVMWFNTYI